MVLGVCVALPIPLALMTSRKLDAEARKTDMRIIQYDIDMEAKKESQLDSQVSNIRVRDNRAAYERRLKEFVDNNVEIIVK